MCPVCGNQICQCWDDKAKLCRYRCQWCGAPTSKDGRHLGMSEIGLKKHLELWNNAEYVPGDSCAQRKASGIANFITTNDVRADLFEPDMTTEFCFPCCACVNKSLDPDKCKPCRHYAL